jgi:hypothetical protein
MAHQDAFGITVGIRRFISATLLLVAPLLVPGAAAWGQANLLGGSGDVLDFYAQPPEDSDACKKAKAYLSQHNVSTTNMSCSDAIKRAGDLAAQEYAAQKRAELEAQEQARRDAAAAAAAPRTPPAGSQKARPPVPPPPANKGRAKVTTTEKIRQFQNALNALNESAAASNRQATDDRVATEALSRGPSPDRLPQSGGSPDLRPASARGPAAPPTAAGGEPRTNGPIGDAVPRPTRSELSKFDGPGSLAAAPAGGGRALTADQQLRLDIIRYNWDTAGRPAPTTPLGEQLKQGGGFSAGPIAGEGLNGRPFAEQKAGSDPIFNSVGVPPPSAFDKNFKDAGKDVLQAVVPSANGLGAAALGEALGTRAVEPAVVVAEAMENLGSDKNVSLDRLNAMKASCDNATERLNGIQKTHNAAIADLQAGVAAAARDGSLTPETFARAQSLIDEHARVTGGVVNQTQLIAGLRAKIDSRIDEKTKAASGPALAR